MIFRLTITLIAAMACLPSWVAGQQAPVYADGALSTAVELRNCSAVNSRMREFSPVFYEGGIVYVTSRRGGPVDRKTGEPYFDLYFAELAPDGMPRRGKPFSLNINTPLHEGPASFTRDGRYAYFTRNNTTASGARRTDGKEVVRLKIYEAERGPVDWINIKELPFNSDDYSAAYPSITPDGNRLFFASDMPGGYGGYDLYMVERRADTWSKPINLGPEINTAADEGFPFYHPDGTLFFASNGHGSMGGLDLFMIDMSGRVWGKVQNLGEPFNSPADDFGLIINRDGTRGYFSSNRPGGEGKDDIYLFQALPGVAIQTRTRLLDARFITYDEETGLRVPEVGLRIFEKSGAGFMEGETFYEIELVPVAPGSKEMMFRLVPKDPDEAGAPVVTTDANGEATYELKGDRQYLIIAARDGYEPAEVTCSTEGEEGRQTIRIGLRRDDDCVVVAGVVLAAHREQGLPGARVRLVNQGNGQQIVLRTDDKGTFDYCLPKGDTWLIEAEKEGYQKAVQTLPAERIRREYRIELDLRLDPVALNIMQIDSLDGPLKQGTVFVLEHIYYDFNDYSIKEGAARELDRLAELMQQYPGMEIELIAHTDSRGTKEYNLALSLKRAEAARKYLIDKGIEPHRIQAFGFGESQLRNHCADGVPCTEEEHAYNRRTEVRIVKMEQPIDIRFAGDRSDQ